MDTIEMKLCSSCHGDIDILLLEDNKNSLFDVPTGKEVVYNDNTYSFCISGGINLPSKVYINDEMYDVVLCNSSSDKLEFKLKDCDKPFLQSFGAVKIEAEISGLRYSSKSIAVMVSNTAINNGVMNMIDYIYTHCEEYIYEEHSHSSVPTGIKSNELISLEAKIAFFQKTLSIYKNSYQYLKISPYSKLQQTQSVENFDKLQLISQSTIRYISNHIDELIAVNYDTGIRYNNQYYQPNKVLVECNTYSYDVYENKIIVGFLKTVTSDIIQIINDLQEQTYTKSKSITKDGYIDSMYHIFSRSIKRINDYLQILMSLKKEYQQLYYFFTKLFGIQTASVKQLPVFTPVFRSINAYRMIYQKIHEWFTIGNYDLGKDDLLLSFISTSKIYEYYCLIKMLHYLDFHTEMKLVEARHASYVVRNQYYTDTKYNNIFVYETEGKKITVYFQPVIYGNDLATNGIKLYRNTSTNARTENKTKGRIYTPDYLIKIEDTDQTNYIILDAKFSTPENIRTYQLQELVYKYLFSLSPLKQCDNIAGLYIICGKTSGLDSVDIVHDFATQLHRTVKPFAEILVMNGTDTSNYNIPALIFKDI